jgi:phospholipase/carboxylesterase
VSALADAFVHEYLPAPSGGDAVTLLLLHGTGSDERGLLHLGPELDEGAGMLSPRGKVDESGRLRFYRRFAPGVPDVDDLHARTYELADWLRAAAERHRFNRSRVVAVGYSNGANVASSLMLLEPGLLAGAVLLRPGFLFEPDRRPRLQGTRVLIAAGRADESVPEGQPARLCTLLLQCGADVTLHWDNAGHALDRREIATAREWLRRHRLARGMKVHEPPL